MGYNSGIKEKIFQYSDRDEYQRIILRASGDDNYPSVGDQDHEGSTHIRDEYVHTLVQKSDMHLDVRALERCLVYLNGQFWGVYTYAKNPMTTTTSNTPTNKINTTSNSSKPGDKAGQNMVMMPLSATGKHCAITFCKTICQTHKTSKP